MNAAWRIGRLLSWSVVIANSVFLSLGLLIELAMGHLDEPRPRWYNIVLLSAVGGFLAVAIACALLTFCRLRHRDVFHGIVIAGFLAMASLVVVLLATAPGKATAWQAVVSCGAWLVPIVALGILLFGIRETGQGSDS